MQSIASIEVDQIPLARQSERVDVYRFTPQNNSKYEYLYNVKCLGIQYRDGPDAGIARLRYVFDSSNSSGDPRSLQDTMGVSSDLAGVVNTDDRIVVFATNPDGSQFALFDGFAQVPELSLSPNQELVHFLRSESPFVNGTTRSVAHSVATPMIPRR